jgi:hypothetical protein
LGLLPQAQKLTLGQIVQQVQESQSFVILPLDQLLFHNLAWLVIYWDRILLTFFYQR